MGNAGSVLIRDKNVTLHRSFETSLFNRRDADWQIRLVLSSYQFAANGGNGYPDGLSDCALYTGSWDPSSCVGIKKDVAFVETSCGYSMREGAYTRVHRDLSIVNAMRGWIGLGSVNAQGLGIPRCS